jgi:hypothetical protein
MPEVDVKELLALMLLKGQENKPEVRPGEMAIIKEINMLRRMLDNKPLGGLTSHVGGG